MGLDQRPDLPDDMLQLCFVHTVKKSRRLTKVSRTVNAFSVQEDDFATVATPEQFKALGHPMRHRLLFALGQDQATISQLAAALGSNKGTIAHHLKVLAGAGLVRLAGTRRVRGGTEQYYRRASPGLKYDDAATTEVAFRALAAEIAAAAPGPFLVLRTPQADSRARQAAHCHSPRSRPTGRRRRRPAPIRPAARPLPASTGTLRPAG